jgi:hypothetical protein
MTSPLGAPGARQQAVLSKKQRKSGLFNLKKFFYKRRSFIIKIGLGKSIALGTRSSVR